MLKLSMKGNIPFSKCKRWTLLAWIKKNLASLFTLLFLVIPVRLLLIRGLLILVLQVHVSLIGGFLIHVLLLRVFLILSSQRFTKDSSITAISKQITFYPKKQLQNNRIANLSHLTINFLVLYFNAVVMY